MIKGLSVTPPVLGRISIGPVIECNGKRLPEKDDQFTITSQVQSKEGWVLHALDEALRENSPNGKPLPRKGSRIWSVEGMGFERAALDEGSMCWVCQRCVRGVR